MCVVSSAEDDENQDKFVVKGKVEICNNTRTNTETSESRKTNVFLKHSIGTLAPICIEGDSLTAGSCIGVEVGLAGTSLGGNGVFVKEKGAANQQYFSSDNDAYAVVLVDDTLKLSKATKPEKPEAVEKPTDDKITSDSITIPTEIGKEYTVVPKGEKPDDEDWVPGTGGEITFDGLDPDTEYDILVRVPADTEEGTPASDPSDSTTVTTKKKVLTFTWSGLDQVYGDGTNVGVTVSGIEPGHRVEVQITGEQEGVGKHTVTATLAGADAEKYNDYTLKNTTATLVIRQKPISVMVTNNATTTDHLTMPTITVPGLSEGTDYQIIYKDAQGQTVPSPSEVGTYEVWVKITNPNYCHADGSGEKMVGSFLISQGKPAVRIVTFEGSSIGEMQVAVGSVLTLPDCGERQGYQFTGWTYDGKTYQPGEYFTMPDSDVTFQAQWVKNFDVTVKVEEEDETPVGNATVSLWLGANKLSEATTDQNGKYTFKNLIPGIYNLVVTKDVRTVTSMVEITKENVTCIAVLPKGATNSIVKVIPGSPDIVVGKLDTVFEKTDEKVYTESDAQRVKAGGKVEFTFTAAEKQPEDTGVSSDLEKIEKIGGSNLALVMDYTLIKTVINADGTPGGSTPIPQANVLLEVRLPLPAELQGKQNYTVYRVYEGAAQALTTSPNALGEYFTVNSDKTVMTLYVKCFSTYAIGYTEYSGNPGGGGGGSTPTYPPVVEKPEHGTVTVSPDAPHKGDEVTTTPKPEDGYQVDEVIVTDQNGKEVEVTNNGDGSYTFTQPDGKVTITVTFKEKGAVSDCPRDESCPMAPFTDADKNAWYHDGVHYCVENGLMVGTGAHTFEPNTTTTRGMIATILWRQEGSPTVNAAMNYTDVSSGSWYEEAIRWADSTGVVLGYGNGTFGPDDPITREQMAAMLWRYAGKPQAKSSLADFVDGEETSQWAESAMLWAVEQGLIEGMGNAQLNPQGQATRAQAATILMRFVEKIEK